MPELRSGAAKMAAVGRITTGADQNRKLLCPFDISEPLSRVGDSYLWGNSNHRLYDSGSPEQIR
ncbi:MAG: hypothetical protein D6B25_20360 [Desulfobulbaceae bacterium]|nr:MAG: hypothetical protein D6B25_20360 [Desulfobulbaceae bacterium]